MPLDVSGRRIVFVGGKGGVGKTTTAAAVALHAAEAGRRCLVVSTDPAHSLGDVFQVRLGPDPIALAPNLRGLELDPDARLEEYLANVKASMRSLVHPDMYGEVDRQVEQVRAVGDEPDPECYDGVAFATVGGRPDLLEQAYPLAEHGYADLALATGTATVGKDAWLRDEATLPDGSIVALADGRIVGYAGLLAWDDEPARAENGLTVVARDWRGRGLAVALKRRQLAWAAQVGIRELVTWTQAGNEAMRRVNERLGYVTRTISRTVERPL